MIFRYGIISVLRRYCYGYRKTEQKTLPRTGYVLQGWIWTVIQVDQIRKWCHTPGGSNRPEMEEELQLYSCGAGICMEGQPQRTL